MEENKEDVKVIDDKVLPIPMLVFDFAMLWRHDGIVGSEIVISAFLVHDVESC